MVDEKNSLLGYLLCGPGERDRIFCKEMDSDRNIHEYTFGNLLCSVFNLARFLDKEDQGEYIPLFLDTSFQFLESFFGVAAAKRVSVPIHTTADNRTIEYILQKVRATCVIVTQPHLYRKLAETDYVRKNIHTIFASPEVIAQKTLPCLHVDLYEIFGQPCSPDDAFSHVAKVVEETKDDDPLQIVFTSGTTGDPKGAVLTHKNVISCVARAANHLHIHSGYRTLSFLPLSHVMGQNEVFIALMTRALVQIVGRENLLHGLKTFQPNILVSVPRVYEAIHQGIQKKIRDKRVAQKLVDFTVRAYAVSRKSPSWAKRVVASLYCKTIGRFLTAKIRKGLGKFNLLVSAGAAGKENVYDFFGAIGMPLTNAQGLTEVSGAVVYNSANETLKGSIGYPLPGVEVKIADDGEILMKGDPIFSGYFEDPQSNALCFTEDGWFRTGDLGRMEIIKGRPYYFIEGRKKEIVVLASGLNITPAQIEEKLLQHNIIQQAVVVGDGQPRLGVLIVPDGTYANNPNLRDEISKIIRQVNNQLDASEKIGNFEILSEPFTIENGMLTPTMKIRRPVVFQRDRKSVV